MAWARHRGRIRTALTSTGFEAVRESEQQSDWLKDGVEATFVFLTRTPDGRIVTHAIPGWSWREDSLPPRRLRLRGRSARVMGPRQLLEEKEGYERGTGSRDMRILRRITAAN